MIRQNFLLCALAVICVGSTGCTQGGGPAWPPTFDLRDRFLSDAAVSERKAVPPAPSLETWWDGFDDPVLSDLVTRALTDNLDIEAATGRIDQARALARSAGADLWPSATVGASYTRERLSRETGRLPSDRTNNLYNADFDSTWEIDLFGRLQDRRDAALSDLQRSVYERSALRLTIAADVAQTYMAIRALQARLDVNRKAVSTQQEQLDLASLRFTSGFSSELDVAQAKALLASTQSVIPLLETDLAVAKNRLDVLLGDAPGTNKALVDTAHALPARPLLPLDVTPASLLRQRPDILAAEQRVYAALATEQAAIKEYYPSISLGALLGLASFNASDLLASSAIQSSASGGLRWRLFDFQRIDAAIDAASGEKRTVIADYRQTVLLAVEDAENALVTLVGQERYARDIERTVKALKRNRDLAIAQYKAGETSFLDTLDASRQLYEAQDTLIQANLNAANALIRSFKAFGGGWTPDAKEP